MGYAAVRRGTKDQDYILFNSITQKNIKWWSALSSYQNKVLTSAAQTKKIKKWYKIILFLFFSPPKKTFFHRSM